MYEVLLAESSFFQDQLKLK